MIKPPLQPPYMTPVDNVTVHVFGPECLGGDIQPVDNVAASTVWTANLVIYVPLLTTETLLVSQFFWYNGTAVSGFTDVGIYSQDGVTKIGSTGATAGAGTSAIQTVDVTDFRLAANTRFWLALGCDNATQTFFLGNLTVAGLDYIGVKQQAAGYSGGLPASATLSTPTVAKIPLFGFTGASVI